MKLKLNGVDYVEFATKSLKSTEHLIARWGFENLGSGSGGVGTHSLWGQGKIRIIITEPSGANRLGQFLKNHGDGICDVGLAVDDVESTFETVIKRGAKPIKDPEEELLGGGKVCRATVAAMGGVTHTFISRKGTDSFLPNLEIDNRANPKGFGMFAVDHVTCNLPMGKLDEWAEFYQKIFDFKQTRFFDINTGRTGLFSKVMENDEGTVKIPLNEPSDKKSQIQEYIDMNHGPGVQHLALLTGNIISTLRRLRATGEKFLDVPDTYYDEVPSRVKGIKEDLDELKSLRILADGDKSGYLLQIFSQNEIGPFFYEVIQRNGNRGFGEGNFRALFEAIERDQQERGVL